MSKDKIKSNAGRPTKFKKEFCEVTTKLCRLGLTDVELAEFFNVSKSTINLWKKDFPDFSDSIREGKIIADMKVVDSLYKRANGFTYTEVKEEYEDNQKTKTTKTKKTALPDTRAQEFWSKNRRPDLWRDKKETDITSGGNPFTGVSIISWVDGEGTPVSGIPPTLSPEDD